MGHEAVERREEMEKRHTIVLAAATIIASGQGQTNWQEFYLEALERAEWLYGQAEAAEGYDDEG